MTKKLILLFYVLICLKLTQSMEKPKEIDLISEIVKVAYSAANTASNYPSITEKFQTESTTDLKNFEKFTKDAVVQQLLKQLLEVWASMNALVRKGIRMVSDLQERASQLVKELEKRGQRNIMDNQLFKKMIEERIKQLVAAYKLELCEQGFTKSPLQKEDFVELENQLGYSVLKSNLIASLPSKSNSDTRLKRNSDETFQTIFEMLWAFEFVTHMLRSVEEPMESLKSSANIQISTSINETELLLERTSSEIEKVVQLWNFNFRSNETDNYHLLTVNFDLCQGVIPIV